MTLMPHCNRIFIFTQSSPVSKYQFTNMQIRQHPPAPDTHTTSIRSYFILYIYWLSAYRVSKKKRFKIITECWIKRWVNPHENIGIQIWIFICNCVWLCDGLQIYLFILRPSTSQLYQDCGYKLHKRSLLDSKQSSWTVANVFFQLVEQLNCCFCNSSFLKLIKTKYILYSSQEETLRSKKSQNLSLNWKQQSNNLETNMNMWFGWNQVPVQYLLIPVSPY